MKSIYILLILFFAACNNSSEKINEDFKKADSELSSTNGEALFKTNCANCHMPDQNYVGPALQGVSKRWESKELLYDFVRNSQEVIGRNNYAKKLFEEYKQSPMLPFPQLNNEEIQAILDYCDTYK